MRMPFIQSWAELIQLIFIVPAMVLAIWDLIIDIGHQKKDHEGNLQEMELLKEIKDK